MGVLIIAEHDNKQPATVNRHILKAALQLGGADVLVAGYECGGVADSVAGLEGVKRVWVCDDQRYQHPLAENLAPLIQTIAADYTHILAAADSFGKDLLPRVAALQNVAQISDVIEIIDTDTFKRPIYAGSAIATVRSGDPLKIITVRGSAFAAVAEQDSLAPQENLAAQAISGNTVFEEQTLTRSERPELTAARVIVAGGRGMGSKENFALLEKLADKLGAAIGASRAAVDAGYIANDCQIGQTGKVVAPELYIAVGISGAIQHLAGIKDSKTIVAINQDEEAPIFQVADYGMVADLFDVLPELTALLE